MTVENPHENQAVRREGRPLDQALAAMILIHGRGATAEDILMLAYELEHPDYAYLAPQAAGYSWYPHSFLAPIPDNEPGISSGIALIGKLVEEVETVGIPRERILIAGFSQGACLGLEYVARNPARFGGVLGFSGGLIGPGGTPRDYSGSLDGTPVFLGCSDVDIHIPKERVEETAAVLASMDAAVTVRFYPGMAHTINQDEINMGRAMVNSLLPKSAGR
jgi:predicted esterase